MDERKKKVLEAYSQGWSMAKAAASVGVHRTAINHWCKVDPEFAEAWEEATQAGADYYEDLLRELARAGDFKAIELNLKARRPEKYTDRHKVEVSRIDPQAGLIEFEGLAQKLIEASEQRKALTDESDGQD